MKQRRNLTWPLVVASLTFLLGVAAARTCFIHRKPAEQEVPLAVPNASWEPSFFASLDEHGRGVNLSRLRTATFPKEDLEVRLWYSAFPDQIYGVIIRRVSDKWTGTFLYGTSESKFGQPFQMKEKQLNVPKSGWEATWQRLRIAELLTLPDASNVPCRSEALDGIAYIVETNVNGTYRTYHYGNPQLMKCGEAAKMIKLAEIVEEEFDMWNPKYRE